MLCLYGTHFWTLGRCQNKKKECYNYHNILWSRHPRKKYYGNFCNHCILTPSLAKFLSADRSVIVEEAVKGWKIAETRLGEGDSDTVSSPGLDRTETEQKVMTHDVTESGVTQEFLPCSHGCGLESRIFQLNTFLAMGKSLLFMGAILSITRSIACWFNVNTSN